MSTRRLVRLFTLILIAACAPSSWANEPTESFGTLEGRVVDSAKLGVPFARFIVVGTRRGAQADEGGRFTLTLVPPGRRAVRILADEFESTTDTIDVVPGSNVFRTYQLRSNRIHEGEFFIPAPRRVISRGELVAEISPVRSPIKVNEHPSFRVRIWNRGTHPIVLVMCNDGAEIERSPRATFEIASPFNSFQNTAAGVAFCSTGMRFDVRKSDFIEVQPGEYFEPFNQAEVTPSLGGRAPTRPGHYSVTFRYSTSESDLARWTRMKPDPELLDLLGRVPVVDLVAKANFKVDY